ncbi:MAG TPA: hypothetical protein VFE19_00950 [Jatrophihabitantaceae bacterium]|jgi:hypothetical protein|nr:hypothetical protein [Jatrophihabitantaceae bacterium]
MAAILLCAVAATGCGHSSGGKAGLRRVAAVRPTLRVAAWVVTGGRLSVLVGNDGPQLVNGARAVLTARDSRGNTVATLSGGQCCTVSGLVPGAQSGVYADLGAPAQRVTSVAVSWASIAATPPPGPLTLDIADVSLQTGGKATIVGASLTLHGPAAAGVSGQAILRDAQGKLVAVVSGPGVCLQPGQAQPIRLRLDDRVPAGTVIGSVTGYPMPGGRC